MPTLAHDPYDGVDWSTVEAHEATLHMHDGRVKETHVHNRIDRYLDAGRTILPVASKGQSSEAAWPHTDFSTIDSNWEDRDPDALGYVTYPASEITDREHVINQGTELMNADMPAGTSRVDAVKEIAAAGGFAWLPHPEWHADWSEWERWKTDFEECTAEELPGLEVFNGVTGSSEQVWARLLTVFMPGRPIYGTAVDDAVSVDGEQKYDRGWTTVYVDGSNFDAAGVQAAMQNGHMTASIAKPWATDAPTVNAISVDTDAETITVDSPDATTVKWISHNSLVHEGATLNYGAGETLVGNHVYAKLEAGVTETNTQPFGFDPPYDVMRIADGGDVHVLDEIRELSMSDAAVLNAAGESVDVQAVDETAAVSETHIDNGTLYVAGEVRRGGT